MAPDIDLAATSEATSEALAEEAAGMAEARNRG